MMRRGAWALVAGLVAGAVGCGESASHAGLVARAGDHELEVDDVVELLADAEGVPTQRTVVRSLADIWIDYTLLAEAADRDTTFARLDFEPLVRRRYEQRMIASLRDSVLQVDTSITPEELRRLYDADEPEVQVRARHILLTYPLQATEEQRDSVRRELEGLRGRIASGTESFESAARSYSQDRGTAPLGGDLGYFGRGDMMASFESAALALQPGEMSDVVATPMGLHLIRVEDRRTPSFEEVAPQFRQQVLGRRNLEAESLYVARLEERVGPELAEGAPGVVRELARNPGTRLSDASGRRPLVEWNGGAVTAGEVLELFRAEQSGLRDQVTASTDEDLEGFLIGLSRRELLVDEARRSGLAPPNSEIDSLVADAHVQLLTAARTLGLLDIDAAPGEERRFAIARAVLATLADNLAGATRIVPLGTIGYQLRDREPVTVFDEGVGQVLIRVAQVRASRGLSPAEQGADSVSQPPDTAGP